MKYLMIGRSSKNPNKVDSDDLRVDIMFMNICKNSALEGSSFWNGERFQRVSMKLIFPIFHFNEYHTVWSMRNDINLSSLYLIIPF